MTTRWMNVSTLTMSCQRIIDEFTPIPRHLDGVSRGFRIAAEWKVNDAGQEQQQPGQRQGSSYAD